MASLGRGAPPKPRQGHFFEPSAQGAPPPPRADHCCVALGAHVVVHGGNSAHGPLDDLYVLDASPRARPWRWERVHASGEVAPARFGHSLVRLTDTSALLFGGADDNEYRWYNDSYTLHFDFGATGGAPGAATHCLSVAAQPAGGGGASALLPTPRCGHSLSLLPSSPRALLLFGGSNTRGALNDLWAFDPDALRWSQAAGVDGAPPPPRAFHASAVVGRTLVVVGGRNGYEYLRDAYTLHAGVTGGGRWTRVAWSAAGEPFPALAYHHLVTLPGGRLLVFGGFGADGTTPLHAAIDLEASRATWRRGEDMPRARSNHSAVLVHGAGEGGGGGGASGGASGGLTVLVFGGFDGHDFCSHLVGVRFSMAAPGAAGGAGGSSSLLGAGVSVGGTPLRAERPGSAGSRRDSFGSGGGLGGGLGLSLIHI